MVNVWRLHDQPYQADKAPHLGAERLPIGAALSVMLLYSLGLWAAIWLAVSSLFSP